MRRTGCVAGAAATHGRPGQSLGVVCRAAAGPKRRPGARPPGAPKVALVFGREDTGLTDSDLRHCDTLCSLPCGRLCESLSLSHCVTAVLARLFEVRTAGTPTPGS